MNQTILHHFGSWVLLQTNALLPARLKFVSFLSPWLLKLLKVLMRDNFLAGALVQTSLLQEDIHKIRHLYLVSYLILKMYKLLIFID